MSLKGVGLLQEMEGLNAWELKITTHMKPLSRTKQQSPRDPEAPGALQHEDFTTCAASVYPVTSEEEKNDHQETQRDVKRKHAVSTKPCLLSNARIFSL